MVKMSDAGSRSGGARSSAGEEHAARRDEEAGRRFDPPDPGAQEARAMDVVGVPVVALGGGLGGPGDGSDSDHGGTRSSASDGSTLAPRVARSTTTGA